MMVHVLTHNLHRHQVDVIVVMEHIAKSAVLQILYVDVQIQMQVITIQMLLTMIQLQMDVDVSMMEILHT